ncbi:MAG: hydrolase [Gammaproteobacteria bacterium]|nr:hydrolase [Gammaproteobacteria bacterium]MCP5135507.1 hydrolase [Gammaproteobacteria bacterium]
MTKSDNSKVADGKKPRAKKAASGAAKKGRAKQVDKAVRKARKREHKLVLRNTRLDDYNDIAALMDRIYPDWGGAWSREQFASQIARFPEGQICIEDKNHVIAASNALIVDLKRFGDQHTYEAITGDGFFTTHDPNADTLYGADIFVDPNYRDLRLGRRLYDARKALCQNLNLKRMVAGGRIPGYRKHADKMSALEYIEQVKAQELRDPVLSFQLANDFHVLKVIHDYEQQDSDSRAHATLLEWINIHYRAKDPLLRVDTAVVRVGAAQWQMRQAPTLDVLQQQIEYFVDVFAGYKADFVLFPEFFSFPLMAQFNQDNPAQAIRDVATYSTTLRDQMQRLAVSYNINIIAGSMPVYDGQKLNNVCYLLRRDGTSDAQYKLHVTPDETQYWGMQGGNDLRVFDTDVGRIGILICYDVEFPELPRILAEQGMQMLFVPYWTDTKNAYERVRRCAQARAIENECYVVITGSVGNLPNVENMDIQYSQAAVFTPSDYAFPHDAIAAEATPNTEMALIADLDLDKLVELRRNGSVRNWRDRRLDLYRVQWTGLKSD